MAFQSGQSHSEGVLVTYDVDFTVLSIFTSVAGCITTLELLHRRTSTKGLFNWFLFIGACIAMGGCGIWSMHFIANRAVILGDDAPEKQIQYSPGFTALSAFLPVLVLGAAFYFLGTNRSKVRPLYLGLAGVLTGTAVCGMHYVGNAGIQNYRCLYKPANIAGSAVIAVAASLVALSVFFRLRETWTDSWWKRALCAAMLASAVCGMHWTAAVGTSYIEGDTNGSRGGTTRVQTVIVCAVLSIGCCLVLLVTAFIRGRRLRLTKTRAQQVVLACAYFDEVGRIMVTQEGAFPCHKITNRYIEKTFGEDELSRSHPTFLWIFRASRNWFAVRDLIPGMVQHLDTDPNARQYRPGYSSPTSDASSEVSVNFSTVFKQLFCVAASQLSCILHEPFENLGVLFEEALDTGTTHLMRPARANKPGSPTNLEKRDVEANAFTLGRGKYLFLNRNLSKTAADRYAAMGYRFASVSQVSDLLAKNMEVKPENMQHRLERMKASVSSEHLPPPGVHLACFMVRPSIHKSFDLLVPAMLQNQLPSAPLKLFLLTDWHKQAIRKYDEWPIRDILAELIRTPGETAGERDFHFTLYAAILQLIEQVGDLEFMLDAVFSARSVELACQSGDEGAGATSGDKCTLLTMRIMNNIHAKPKPDMTYVPLSFFGAQQVVEAGGARQRERWERRVRMEFGYGSSRKYSQASDLPSPMTSPWGTRAGERTRGSMSVQSFRIWPSWLRKDRKDSYNSRDQHESEDETRIVKTVEISLKEEKEDSSSTRNDSSPDVTRLGSNGAESSFTGGNPSMGGDIADEFEKREVNDRSTYVAGVSSGIGPGMTTSGGRLSVVGGIGMEMVELEAAEKGDGGWVSEVFGMFRL